MFSVLIDNIVNIFYTYLLLNCLLIVIIYLIYYSYLYC